jgi:uncharacterized protein DUF4388
VIDTLIISTDHLIFDEINAIFPASSYNFEYADSTEAAMDFLESEAPDFIFVIEKNFEKISEIMNKIGEVDGSDTLVKICFTSDLSKEERISLFKAGSLDIVDMPVSKDEFKMLYEKYCNSLRNGKEKLGSVMQGKLEDFSIIDIVQSLEDGKKTAILELKRNGDSGQILIKNGQICSAEYRKFNGLTAILNMVGWIRGDFYIEFTDQDFEKEIEQDNQEILMESVHRIDERTSYLKQLPPVDDIILIAPNVDMQKMSEKDIKYIKFFHGGNTIYQFLINFTSDDFKLLDVAVKLYSKKHLLTREQFDAFTTEYEAEVAKGGIVGFFGKMFKKNGKAKDSKTIAERRKRDKTQIINPNLDDQIRESVVLIDPVELNEFKEKIAEL